MKICNKCGAENPEQELRCGNCGAALDQEENKTGLLGSMGGKRYTDAPSAEDRPSGAESGEKSAESPAAPGLLGSMGGKRFRGTVKPAGKTAPGKTDRESGLAGSMGDRRYGTRPEDAPTPSLKEGGVAGSMGAVRYGIKPPAPPSPPAAEPEEKKPDKGLIISAALIVAALAATMLLVFWNSLFGGAEIYGMGIGGFINYYKPVEEEEILEEDGVKYVGDQMVIVSALNVPRQEMEDFFSGQNMTVIGDVEPIDTYQVQLDRTYTLQELHEMSRELEKDPLVDSATVNAVHENSSFTIPSDPWDEWVQWDQPAWGASNWGVMAVRAPQSWRHWEPEEVRAGVVDSVFDEEHPDLHFAMTKDNEIFGMVRDEDSKAHGTHVAGIIGAIHDNGVCCAGVAENCVIYGYSTMRYEGTIEEVSAIAELAAQDVRVVNYSMGLIPEIRDPAIQRNGMERDVYYRYASAFSQTAMKHLLSKGYDFVLVCAAGNDPVEAEWASEYAYITDPEIRDRILVVGAAGINSGGVYYQASWSGLGERVDVLAPGVEILSTYPGGGCAYMSGTSMAAPHVTGICASVWALNPRLSGAEVKSLVIRTADIPVPGGDANMVNMYAAMAAAEAAG